MKVSQRAQGIPVSATLAVTSRAKELKKQGIDIVSYGAGEPDFDTPDYIKEAAIEALKAGKTKYTAAGGIIELRETIAEKFRKDNGLHYSADQIIVNIGGKHSVYECMQAVLDPGDEVILQTPYWVTYTETVKLAGATPKIVKTSREADYKMKPEQLKAALTDKTAMVVINSPNNPGGFTYTPEELAALGEVLTGTDIMVLSDEMYEKLIYKDTKFISFASLNEDMFNRTITLNGLSKAFSMTGWRLGYAAGPVDVIKAMGRLQSHMTSNAVTFVQYAAITALGEQSVDAIETMRQEFEKRAEHMSNRLDDIDGVICPQPTGAFYCFPDVSSHYGRNIDGKTINGSLDFAQILLEQANVALVPGLPFGCDENVRLSFACSLEHIDKGLDRLEQWLKQ